MSKLPIKNVEGQPLGDFDLSDELLVFDKGSEAMHASVVAYRAHQRMGTASTLSKGEVAGSNKKPWRQKGLGRARAGYRQSPIWRGGAVAFGPKPRRYHKRLNKKTARLAFRRAFSERVAAGGMVVLDEISMEKPKTKEFASMLRTLDAPKGALFVLDRIDPNVALSARNIPSVEVTTSKAVNTYQLLRHPLVVVTKAAMAELESRLRNTNRRPS